MKQTKGIREPRPIRFRHAPIHDPDFHDLQIALALYAQDEGAGTADRLIREACYDAADEDDRHRAQRLETLTAHSRSGSRIGPKLACEILAALGRYLDDCENGREP